MCWSQVRLDRRRFFIAAAGTAPGGGRALPMHRNRERSVDGRYRTLIKGVLTRDREPVLKSGFDELLLLSLI